MSGPKGLKHPYFGVSKWPIGESACSDFMVYSFMENSIGLERVTVHLEIFVRILFSRLALKEYL